MNVFGLGLIFILSIAGAPFTWALAVDRSDADWKSQLRSESYKYCRHVATEPSYSGQYVSNHDVGTYQCSSCGVTIFSSDQKFDSGTGCASFKDVVKKGVVDLKSEKTLGVTRYEVICSHCGAHLGYVYDDGPGVLGKRYCINSACLSLKELPTH